MTDDKTSNQDGDTHGTGQHHGSTWSENSHFLTRKEGVTHDTAPTSHKHPASSKRSLTSRLKLSWRQFVPLIVLVVALVCVFAYLTFVRNKPTSNADKSYVKTTYTPAEQTQKDGSNTPNDTALLWDSSQHGILAFEGGESDPTSFVLLNPNNGSVLAQETIPNSGKLDGNSYNIAGESGGGGTYFSANYRYIAIQFDAASNSSQDVGYYDLETNQAYDISNNTSISGQNVTVDTQPMFNPLDSNLLLFTRNTAGTGFSQGTSGTAQTYSYNMTTKQIQTFSGTAWNGGITCPDVSAATAQLFSTDEDGCDLSGQGASAGMGFNEDDTCGPKGLVVDITPSATSGSGTTRCVEAVQNGQLSTIDCGPEQWLSNGSILCSKDDQSNFFTVDMAAMTASTDGDGDSIYSVPTPSAEILPANSRTNNTPVASPDGKTIDFISSTQSEAGGLYQAPVSGGQPKEIMKLGENNSESLYLIAWR